MIVNIIFQLREGETLTILFQSLPASRIVSRHTEAAKLICMYATLGMTYEMNREESKQASKQLSIKGQIVYEPPS